MSALHLIALPVDIRTLRRWAATRGHGADEGRALHHLLVETFGRNVLQPFRLMASPGGAAGTLYAYSRADYEALRETAAETATPDALQVCELAGLASKVMPTTWKTGRRLAFDLLARPVKRLLKPAGVFSKGAEVDSFLVDALRKYPEGRPPENRIDRERSYEEWLRERLRPAAELNEARLVGFERRAIERDGRLREGPDATWHGEFTVLDGAALVERLAKGVGRHSAYGYGMLLLRPAAR